MRSARPVSFNTQHQSKLQVARPPVTIRSRPEYIVLRPKVESLRCIRTEV